MSSYSVDAVQQKFLQTTGAAHAIQNLSTWLIHYRKRANEIVKIWKRVILKASPQRKLILMYVSNDVIQNSKRKGREFAHAYQTCLPEIFAHLASAALNQRTVVSIRRILDIWRDRNVFPASCLDKFYAVFDGASFGPETVPECENTASSESGKKSTQSSTAGSQSKSQEFVEKSVATSDSISLYEGVNESVIDQFFEAPAKSCVDSSDLIKYLNVLESAPSADAVTREKIANLSPNLSDPNIVDKTPDISACKQLRDHVTEALTLLADYNERLTNEMQERKKTSVMLREYTLSQKDAIVRDEKMLEECRSRLEKAYYMREQLKSHIQNLPDIGELEEGDRSILPSAGDLFR